MDLVNVLDAQSYRKQQEREKVGDGRFKYRVGGRRDCASSQHFDSRISA